MLLAALTLMTRSGNGVDFVNKNTRRILAVTTSLLLGMGFLTTRAEAQSIPFSPAKMPRIGSVSERFQSYNIEMVEVTGGRFWAPYKLGTDTSATPEAKLSTPVGMDPSLYRYRPPIDLTNPRLRMLAAALGPAYVRVSGTWANSTYFHDSDTPAPKAPPEGFGGVLTREEWKGVVDFAKAVNAGIVTSFAISPGVRDANGVWTPVEAKKLFGYTKSVGGEIAAAEMFNEPTLAVIGGAPKGYDAAAYGRDFRVFHAFVKDAAPKMIVLGPGSTAESATMGGSPPGINLVRSEDMLAAEGPGPDAFSYHFYGGVSKRCARLGSNIQVLPENALSDDWLSRTNREEAFYAGLRDRFLPGKPMWLTETAEAACGGDLWAASFIDSFRYLNQLGTLAKRGVQVVMHNTLAASDYGLIDETTLEPRPNYWSALLWRKLMGTTVLDAGVPSGPELYVYAHCLRGQPGGVALLAINANRAGSHELELPQATSRYTLTAEDLMAGGVWLNGNELKLTSSGDLPAMQGVTSEKGRVALPPASITFLGIAKADNPNCR
jgi:heparanase